MPKNHYHFWVKDAKEIDIKRICDEQPADVPAFVLSKGGNYSFVAIRKSILEQFRGSNIEFLGWYLDRSWGWPGLKTVNAHSGPNFQLTLESQDHGFRFVAICSEHLDRQREELRKILAAGPPKKYKILVEEVR